MKYPALTVAVSGLHRGENPQPGPAVIRSLHRRFRDLRIVGLSYDSFESALFSADDDAADIVFSMPFPGAGRGAFLDRLDVVRAQEPIDIIIPCLDAELDNLLAIAPALKDRGIGICLPDAVALARRDKINLPTLCAELGIHIPATRIVYERGQLFNVAYELGYPLYVKGRLYEAHLVANAAELEAAFDQLTQMWGGPVVVQRPVAGEEYDFAGIGDGTGGIHGRCTMRKMLKSKAGKATAGVVISDPTLDAIGEKLIRALRWKGPFELELIRTPAGYVLIEMNPRFPAWIDFPSQLGCNLPAALVEELRTGRTTTPIADCVPGRMFVRHSIDLVGDIADVAEMTAKGNLLGRRLGGLHLVGDRRGLDVVNKVESA